MDNTLVQKQGNILNSLKKVSRIVVLLTLFLSFTSKTNAQDGEEEGIGKVDLLYTVANDFEATLCADVNGTPASAPNNRLIPKGRTFYVIEGQSNGSVIMQLWFEGDKEEPQNIPLVFANNEDAKQSKRQTYIVPFHILKSRCRRRYATTFISRKAPRSTWLAGTSITGGVVLMPFKLRPAVTNNGVKTGFDFSKDLQLGISGGIRQKLTHYNPFFLNVLLNVGISSVMKDSFNTGGQTRQPTDVAAFTYAIGIVFDFAKIQFGVFAGRDRLSARDVGGWVYQNKTWWSVGFGYTLFSVSTKPVAQSGGAN